MMLKVKNCLVGMAILARFARKSSLFSITTSEQFNNSIKWTQWNTPDFAEILMCDANK